MLRFVALSVGIGAIAALAFTSPTQVSADDKSPSIETIMKKLHGKNGTHKVINKSLDAAAPDWAAISKDAKTYADLAVSLEKTTPEKGAKDSWAKLTKSYTTDAKALAGAAEKKDKDAAKTAFGKLKESCDACHENHR